MTSTADFIACTTDGDLLRRAQAAAQMAGVSNGEQWAASSLVAICLHPGDSGLNLGAGTVRGAVALTAGTHSITARLVRSSGTGTATLVATSATPALLTVTPA